jgi:eukaryotic-like serine/threonine-protein kinase
MAEVWEASDGVSPSVQVAIKVLLPHFAAQKSFQTMFRDEVRIASLLHHENIVKVLGSGEAAGTEFIAMEYLEGWDLKGVLIGAKKQPGAMDVPVCLRVAADAARALSYAHGLRNRAGRRLDTVHRDVSPHNLFVTSAGVTKVLDFGVAWAKERLTRTQPGVIKGKLRYMSPEQARANGVSASTDVFALGVVLFEMLTGCALFNSGEEALAKFLAGDWCAPDVATLAGVLPDGLPALVNAMLCREPERRPQTMAEVEQRLRYCMARSFDPRAVSHLAVAASVARYVSHTPVRGPTLVGQVSTQDRTALLPVGERPGPTARDRHPQDDGDERLPSH